MVDYRDDWKHSKPPTGLREAHQQYSEGWERVFGKIAKIKAELRGPVTDKRKAQLYVSMANLLEGSIGAADEKL